MVRKGFISQNPQKKLKLILSIQILWLLTICLLGAWWGYLLFQQADRIVELEKAAGIASSISHENWAKTQRMVVSESIAFFVILLISLGILFWLYQREIKRAHSVKIFFASMTHELRTPLTSIRLQGETLQERVPPQSKEMELLRRLLEDTTRMESQVEKTLELARVEGGGQLARETVHIKSCTERVIRKWQETLAREIQIENQTEDLAVEGDSSALQVILKNLLDNSLKHAKTRDLKIAISTESSPDEIVMNYRDNGESLKGDLSQFKKVFNRGTESTGTGVGLYLVSVLMRQMGGDVEFKSNPGFQALLRFKRMMSHA